MNKSDDALRRLADSDVRLRYGGRAEVETVHARDLNRNNVLVCEATDGVGVQLVITDEEISHERGIAVKLDLAGEVTTLHGRLLGSFDQDSGLTNYGQITPGNSIVVKLLVEVAGDRAMHPFLLPPLDTVATAENPL